MPPVDLVARERRAPHNARFGVYLTATELELAARAVDNLPRPSLTTRALVERLRLAARHARTALR